MRPKVTGELVVTEVVAEGLYKSGQLALVAPASATWLAIGHNVASK